MNYLPNSSLTSYCAFCPQNQTGSSTMLTGNASVQIPTNYHYNCLMNTNLYTTDNAAINSNLNIRVTDQDTSFLTSSSRIET
ncbi:unnamed protein product [Heterobilharzia americana]|nr:unnamed protein product [Heterobilharzia americana]